MRTRIFLPIFIPFAPGDQHILNATLKMKRISLDRLENQLSEAVLIKAEQLGALYGMPEVEEVDENLWVAVVEHNEVEILLSGRTTQQYTCECAFFSQEKSCPHLGLVLMALRRVLQPSRASGQEPDATGSGKLYGAKRLTTAALLEHAEDAKLRAFIKAYARENRTFALALRARFSSHVPTTSEEDKYKNLINSIFNSQYKPGKPYTATATAQVAQLLHYVIQDLAEQVTLGQFQAPVLMVRVLIEKLPPVLNLAGDEKEALLKILRTGIKLLERMANEPVSPHLMGELWEILEAELAKPYCIKNDLHINILDLLASIAPELGKESDYLHLLFKLSAISNLSVEQQIELNAHRLQALNRMGSKDDLCALAEEIVKSPTIAIGVLGLLLHYKSSSSLLPFFVDSILAAGLPVHEFSEPAEQLVDWLKNEGRLDEALELSIRYFLNHPADSKLARCKQLAADQWGDVFNQLLEGIRNHPEMGRDEKNRQVASLLYHEKRTPELLRHLAGQESLALLRRYTPSLLPDAQSHLLDVYYKYFENYLREYLGRKPAQRVRTTIESLRNEGACKLADELLVRIRQSFPQRRSLIEELEML